MQSKKLRLTEILAEVAWLRAELAPISESYLRRLPRASGVPLTPEVEGDFAALERTLLATTDRAAVLLAKRHAELVCRSSRASASTRAVS